MFMKNGTHTKLGEGVVVSRTKIHHKPVTSEEVALQVTSVEGDDELKHPYYDYPVEARSFAAWPVSDVCVVDEKVC